MEDLKLTIAGLYTHPNPLSEIPDGALAVADNCVIDRESVAESRRGFKQYTGEEIEDAKKLFNFKGRRVLHAGTSIYVDDGEGIFDELTGTYDVPAEDYRMPSLQANDNLYLGTDQGIIKLSDAEDDDLKPAGVPRGEDLAVATTGASGFIPDQTQVAYRIVWGSIDANENLILGSPSQRGIVINGTGGTRNASLNFSIPPSLTTDYFFQVYRSLPSVALDVTPDDQLQLAGQLQLDGTMVSAGVITYTDSLPDLLLGAALYTNVGQDGIGQTNDLPPLAVDMSTFDTASAFTFYANTKQRHRALCPLTALPAIDTTVVITDGTTTLTYTAKAAENFAAKQYKTFSGGDFAADLIATIKSLIRAINRDTSNSMVRAYYLDTNYFFIERVDFGAGFSATGSGAFLPASVSSDFAAKNGLMVAKAYQPEAVPFNNTIPIGRSDKTLYRFIGLRDAGIILKEDGIFRISGTDPSNFQVEVLDATYVIKGPETATKLGNHVFCCSNQGVIAISPSGVTLMSRQIERTVLALTAGEVFNEFAWGVGYDSDRKYILGVPSTSTSVGVDYCLVYNIVTNSWTRWPLELTHALVDEGDDRLYVIRRTDDIILQERKERTIYDYADDEFGVEITDMDGSVLELDSVDNLAIGMTIKQGSQKALITAIDEDDSTVTVNIEDGNWDEDEATVYTPIPVRLQWHEFAAGNPGITKHFGQITFFFDQARFYEIAFRIASNFVSAFKTTLLKSRPEGKWGRGAWGRRAWSTGLGDFQPLPTYCPRESSRAHWVKIELFLKQAFTTFGCAGCAIEYENASGRFR